MKFDLTWPSPVNVNDAAKFISLLLKKNEKSRVSND